MWKIEKEREKKMEREINGNKTFGNTAFNKINHQLRHFPWYQDFLGNKISRASYLAEILKHQDTLMSSGLNEDQLHLSSRFPINAEQKVDSILKHLQMAKAIPTIDYPKAEFQSLFASRDQNFKHQHFTTYIFPEEARLLFALTHIMKPKRMLFLGSYYGYWSIWALAVLKKYGGEAYLIDIDEKAIQLSKENIQQFGYEDCAQFINEDVMSFINRAKIPHDFIVLDAEGPKVGANPDLLDKAIYYPMIAAAEPYLSKNGMLLCHNILLNNPIQDHYFEAKIAYNNDQFTKFFPYLKKHFSYTADFDTTEGVGISLKSHQ